MNEFLDNTPRSSLKKGEKRDERHVTFSLANARSQLSQKKSAKDQKRKQNGLSLLSKKHKCNQNVARLQKSEDKLLVAEVKLERLQTNVAERTIAATASLTQLAELAQDQPDFEQRKYSIKNTLSDADRCMQTFIDSKDIQIFEEEANLNNALLGRLSALMKSASDTVQALQEKNESVWTDGLSSLDNLFAELLLE